MQTFLFFFIEFYQIHLLDIFDRLKHVVFLCLKLYEILIRKSVDDIPTGTSQKGTLLLV